jgi:glutathione synthase/RimK-type ligase-like ATP-grasp enzyme
MGGAVRSDAVAILVHHDAPGPQPAALAAAVRARGHEAEVVSVRDLSCGLNATGATLWVQDAPFTPRAVLTQGLNRSWSFVSGWLAASGLRVVNPVAPSTTALDKWATARVLFAAGVATLPVHAFPWGARPPAAAPFTPPVILKPVAGSNGREVRTRATWADAQRDLATDRVLGPEGLVGSDLVQPQATSAGADLRVLVLADDPVASVRRVAHEGVVANWSHAEVTPWRDDVATALAVAAVAALGLAYGGVDLVWHEEQWFVLEVNCWPRDLEIMGRFAGVDIVDAVVGLVLDA